MGGRRRGRLFLGLVASSDAVGCRVMLDDVKAMFGKEPQRLESSSTEFWCKGEVISGLCLLDFVCCPGVMELATGSLQL